ncbi:MAG: tetratricopeptide repeat protein, partial [Nitrospirae bacterium]
PSPLPDRSGRYLALLLDCLARERREAPERVRPVLEELARLDAPDPRIYRWLGLEAHRRGDEAEAISHFERAVRLAPRSAPDLFDLATLYLLAERYPEAIRTFDRVIRLQPPFLDDAYAYLGYCLDRMGAAAEARRAWRTALELDPDNAVARRYLSEAGLSPPPAAGGPGAAAPGAPPPRPPAPGAPGPGGR